MQVEQSANMIIIALAHAQASGDGSLLNQYVCTTNMTIFPNNLQLRKYNQFSLWAGFLINNTLIPRDGE